MHSEGYQRNINGESHYVSPEEAFPGNELPKFLQPIKEMVKTTGATSILDYGCGKGRAYDQPVNISGQIYTSLHKYWEVERIERYEPALPEFETLPEGKVDGVISTDVLEHIPVEDVFWVIEEMFAISNKFVFANVACYKALATLPNGENAHVTVRHPMWWGGVFESMMSRYPDHKYLLGLMGPTTNVIGQTVHQMGWLSNINIQVSNP